MHLCCSLHLEHASGGIRRVNRSRVYAEEEQEGQIQARQQTGCVDISNTGGAVVIMSIGGEGDQGRWHLQYALFLERVQTGVPTCLKISVGKHCETYHVLSTVAVALGEGTRGTA